MQKSKVSLKEFWTFRNVSRKKFTHGLHKYPARMHPEIAKNIIAKYAESKRTVIIDPFVGSGGVLIESMLKKKIKEKRSFMIKGKEKQNLKARNNVRLTFSK